jgi:hypothetical protein
MPRNFNADLTVDWKVCLPATVSGLVEAQLFNSTTGKPRYGERSKLIAFLLAKWLKDHYRINVDLGELPSADLIPESYNEPVN